MKPVGVIPPFDRLFCLMNVPNQLTLGRLVLTIAFVASLSIPWPGSATAALALFLLASLTDFLDGFLARRWGLTSDFGALMDPLADKIMTAAAFIMLVATGALPAWAVVVIVSREFLITGLRMLASSKGIVLPAEKLGKHKTAWQIITILYFLLAMTLEEIGGNLVPPGFTAGMFVWGQALVAVTVVLTLWSGLGYLARHRDLIATS